jgi:hypothetical protein
VSTLLIVHHSPSPATHALMDAAVRGASDPEITGVRVVRRAALSATAADVLGRRWGAAGHNSEHRVHVRCS